MTQTTRTIHVCVSNLKRPTDPIVLLTSKLRSTYELYISHRRTLPDKKVTYSYKPVKLHNKTDLLVSAAFTDTRGLTATKCVDLAVAYITDSWMEQVEVNVAVRNRKVRGTSICSTVAQRATELLCHCQQEHANQYNRRWWCRLEKHTGQGNSVEL